jgi:hypothetical protein
MRTEGEHVKLFPSLDECGEFRFVDIDGSEVVQAKFAKMAEMTEKQEISKRDVRRSWNGRELLPFSRNKMKVERCKLEEITRAKTDEVLCHARQLGDRRIDGE